MEENSVISKIYDSNGQKLNYWKKLLFEIKSDNKKINDEIFTKLNQSILDKINIDLTLDIMDFIIIYGNNMIIDLIAKNEYFLINIKHLLKRDAQIDSETTLKKVISLIQKWGLYFYNNEKYSIFKDNYLSLKYKIRFPSPDEIETYQKYYNEVEINQTLTKIDEILIQKKKI